MPKRLRPDDSGTGSDVDDIIDPEYVASPSEDESDEPVSDQDVASGDDSGSGDEDLRKTAKFKPPDMDLR